MFEIELFICIIMDLALNNIQRLICHKPPPQKNKKTKQTLFDLVKQIFFTAFYTTVNKDSGLKLRISARMYFLSIYLRKYFLSISPQNEVNVEAKQFQYLKKMIHSPKFSPRMSFVVLVVRIATPSCRNKYLRPLGVRNFKHWPIQYAVGSLLPTCLFFKEKGANDTFNHKSPPDGWFLGM